ncbi:DUF6364 family protein [Mucilaginibacter gotjawali]|uniref:Uncharacterized protein n=2 Tax=Mucilaginibacter gotjawali TaxID=1550579 RepID=A0A839SDP8_9SPHI|nr:DUF6364 family protein [Mucilaginibacter gotjawali]MBB3055413.1 hypothetical protein [Mucilaginibacter gotjawali]BAU53309.1 hypothetical protein MgSA37_01476 [Mucilaginibacter gotjawali]
MATTKLTLSVDEDTINLAKHLASENNTSVSRLFKRLINEFPKKENPTDPILEKYKNVEIPGWIKDLSIKTKIDLPANVDYKDLKYEYLKEKYGL